MQPNHGKGGGGIIVCIMGGCLLYMNQTLVLRASKCSNFQSQLKWIFALKIQWKISNGLVQFNLAGLFLRYQVGFMLCTSLLF